MNLIILILYFISRAYTEAHKWGAPLTSHRYHLWRFIESFAPLMLAINVFGIFIGAGIFLMGMFLYERILNQRISGKWFKERGWEFKIGGIVIRRFPIQDWIILSAGTVLLILSKIL